MITRISGGLLLATVWLGFSSVAAQQSTPQQPSSQRPFVFKAGVQTVAIYATVVDSAGRLVADLEQKDFEVYDNGKKQELSIFKTDVQPVSVVVMLDTSGSMTANLDLLKNGA